MHWGVIRDRDSSGSAKSHVGKKLSDKRKESDEKRVSKYKNRGYTEEQAKILSDGERRAKKALMITGGVVLTAAVAYGAYRYHDYAKDSLIKASQSIQTVHREAVEERLAPGNPFYASFTKKDKAIYASPFFSHFKDSSQVTNFYTKEGIKVASNKSGEKIFKQLLDDDQGFREYTRMIGIDHGTPTGKAYLKFNKALVQRTHAPEGMLLDFLPDHDKNHNVFYTKLKSLGYGGVIDLNDSVIEGFTHKPTIIFSDTHKYITSSTKATAEELGKSRESKSRAYATARKIMRQPLKNQGVQIAAIVGASSTTSYLTNLKSITDYKVKHPKTKLSEKEILKLVAY